MRSSGRGTPSTARHDRRVTQQNRNAPGTDHNAVWATRRTAFSNAADAYAFGRPSYAADAVEWVLPPGARRVLDLAAGTGRLTERLLERGLDVIAVEPLAEMRAHVPAGADARDGTAEAIPLEDASVDAVTVGQGFHWFDVPRAGAEIARVLRPGGVLGLMWNMIDDNVAWVDRLATLLDAEERFSFLREDQPPPYSDLPGLTTPERRIFRHEEPYDADRLVAYVLSRSQTILLPEDERAALITAVRGLIPEGEFPLPMMCDVWRGERTA